MVKRIAVLGILTLFSASMVYAQNVDQKSAQGTADFRLGIFFDDKANPYSLYGSPLYALFGFRVGKYFDKESIARRLSFNFSFDYMGTPGVDWLSSEDIEVEVGPPYKREKLVGNVGVLKLGLLPQGNIGFDLLQIPHLSLTLHSGAALLLAKSEVHLMATYNSGNSLRELCDLQEYSSFCGWRSNVLGTAGATLRIFPKKSFYAGIDYSFFTNDKKQFVLVTGWLF